MRRGVVVFGFMLGAAAGCGFGPGTPETANDAGVDVGTNCTSFATKVDTCQLSFEGEFAVDGMAPYDTDSHMLIVGTSTMTRMSKSTTIEGDPVDVISARNIRIAAHGSLRVTGSRALVLIANDTLVIE